MKSARSCGSAWWGGTRGRRRPVWPSLVQAASVTASWRTGPSSRTEEWRPCVLAQLASVTTTEAGDAESGEMYTDYSATHSTANLLLYLPSCRR